jgi:membrane protease YdiL (CAAX protease family)
MDHLEDFKDKETINLRPDRVHALFHLVLGIIFFFGAALAFAGLASVLCSYLVFGEVASIREMSGLLDGLKTHPIVLKLFVFISSSLPLIAAALLACIFIKAAPVRFLSLNRPKNRVWFGLSIVFVIVCVPLMGLMLEANKLIDFSQWPEFYEWLQMQENTNNGMYEAMIGEKNTASFITSILFMALMPAIAEEIFFRGFLMNVFNGLFKNMHVAIFVTAVIFSLIHLQFMKFIPMLFLAVVFGYAAYWSGSIWTSVIAHFLNNALAVAQLYFITDGDYTKAIEEGANIPILVSGVLIAIGVALFVYIQKNSSTKTENFYV